MFFHKVMKHRKLILVISSAITLLLLNTCASSLYKSAIYYERKKAGLSNKTVQIENYTMNYLESGKGTPILMLHGFGGEKDHWTRFSNYLGDKYHLIAPDLPGFGDNARDENRKYSYPAQVESIHKFVQTVLPGKKFHIIGNSMGGGISGLYAATYPEDVLSLALIDAGGVKSPEESELTINLKKGLNVLIVKNKEDFDRLLKFSFVKPINIPGSVKEYLTEKAILNYKFNTRIFDEVMADKYLLQEKLNKIKSPALIVWGDTDRILHVSGADIFQKGIQNSKKVILKDCGHAPMLELPEETAAVYTKFLSGL